MSDILAVLHEPVSALAPLEVLVLRIPVLYFPERGCHTPLLGADGPCAEVLERRHPAPLAWALDFTGVENPRGKALVVPPARLEVVSVLAAGDIDAPRGDGVVDPS